jgi:hypothetical protein
MSVANSRGIMHERLPQSLKLPFYLLLRYPTRHVRRIVSRDGRKSLVPLVPFTAMVTNRISRVH